MIEAAKTSQETDYETTKDQHLHIESKRHKGRLVFLYMLTMSQVPGMCVVMVMGGR